MSKASQALKTPSDPRVLVINIFKSLTAWFTHVMTHDSLVISDIFVLASKGSEWLVA